MQKLDPKAIWIFFFRFLLSGLFIFFFVFIWSMGFVASFFNDPLTVVILWCALLFILYLIFSWVWAKLTYNFFLYQLNDNSFKKEQGVIWKKYVSIPYERIQNVDIHRGVIARILGLSDLYIQTAGSSAVVYGRRMSGVGAEGYLPGLNKGVAEQLREELVKRSKSSKQGL
jgi:uncharacterized membrane protein YdbT with pleckstrin-like domain